MTIKYISDNSILASTTVSNGDVVLLETNKVFSAASIPASILSADNLTVGYFGTGDLPIISGGAARFDWTYNSVHNVYSRPAYLENTLGNVTEDGIPMKFVPWTTNLATTAAMMVSGNSLPFWSGSMTYDPANKIVYIRPSTGNANDHEYVVSEYLNGFYDTAITKNLSIDGISFRSLSRHGIDLKNKRGLKITNCNFNIIGGVKPASLWMGNGIELARGVWGSEVLDCQFSDIFDSPVTSQLYESSPAAIGSHLWKTLIMNRYGLHGVEISCQTTAQDIHDIEIADINSKNQGVCWSGDRNGAVITYLTQGGSSRVNRSFARNVTGETQRRLYLGYQHAGICGIEDSIGVGTYGQPPRSDSNGRAGQTDIFRNVSDNLGTPTGGNWVSTTTRLKLSFS